jgi:formylglycine-generating enzyme required for sulfatase activity
VRVSQFIAVAWLVLIFACAPAHAEKRVALVIGNGAYKNLPALKNPLNDARDLAEALRKLDFDVDLGVNLRLGDMQDKLKAFAKRAQTADVALAFFAGHGVQAPDPLGSAHAVNYLLPTDVGDINEPGDLSFLITARDIVARLQAAGSVRILILDACRNNPIPLRLARARGGSAPRGLSAEPKTAGTLIAYSTQPDMVADDGPERNSPFMKALLAHIDEPGLDVRLLFTDVRSDVMAWSNGAQTPETSDSLNGRFMFRKAGAAAGPPATTAAQPAPQAVSVTAAPTAAASQQQVAAVAPPVTPAVPAGPCGVVATVSSEPGCTPLTAVQERGLKPKDSFRECADCPEMVVVPAGSFTMGSPKSEKDRFDWEGPQHVVTIRKPFAVGKFHVTVDQFSAFVRETRYKTEPECATFEGGRWPIEIDGSWRNPGFTQEGSHPVVCLSWVDATAYVDWLAKKTGKPYRLLSEAEWEYAARGQTSPGAYPRFWFGNDEKALCRYGNGLDKKAQDTIEWAKNWTVLSCNDGYAYTSPAGRYEPNAFGLHDMTGNAWEWTADCWHDDYNGAPVDGSAWTTGCGGSGGHMVRGASWGSDPGDRRAAHRIHHFNGNNNLGFRVARTLAP